MGKASRTKRDRRAGQPTGDRRAIVERLHAYEERIDHDLPGWVDCIDKARAVAPDAYGAWPQWCLVPMVVPYAAALHYGLVSLSGLDSSGQLDRAGLQWPAVLAALYTWRQGRGIYRFDAELAEAVIASDLPANIGTDLLYRLPEWGLYIDPAGVLGPDIAGFWVHLEWDVKSHAPWLRILWDFADGTVEIGPVALGHPSIAAALDAALVNADQKATELGLDDNTLAQLDGEFNVPAIQSAVLLTLYLCTEDADIVDPDRANAVPRRALRPRDHTLFWDVGYRLGSALRAARSSATTAHGGSHRSPAAHLRRAHWHNYWVGPKDGERRQTCKWLHPILVGAGEVLPTLHEPSS